jgi:hypothetical protein
VPALFCIPNSNPENLESGLEPSCTLDVSLFFLSYGSVLESI